MQNATKLTNDEFLALRSIHRDPWCSRLGVLWKAHGVWLEVGEDGWARRAGSEDAYRWRGELIERAHAALDLLLQRGLVQEELVPCCPDPTCHRSDYLLWTLTKRGEGLISSVYPNPTALPG